MTNTRHEQQNRDAREASRFWALVAKDENPRGCWIWIGAISDDGYGRFWVRRDGGQRAVRPHRYAYALVHGETSLEEVPVLMHACDNPLCVRASVGDDSHLWPGDQAANLIDRAQKGNALNQYSAWRGLTRAQKAERSRQLRQDIKDGLPVGEAVSAFVARMIPGQLPLF